MFRGIAAVLGGFLAMVAVVVVGTLIATKIFLPGTLNAPGQRPTPPYLAANLTVSLLAAILGGYTAKQIARGPGWTIVGILAGFVGLMSILTMVQAKQTPDNGQPPWYLPVIAVISISGILIGGWIGRSR